MVICFTISINMGFTGTMAKTCRALIEWRPGHRILPHNHTFSGPSEIVLINMTYNGWKCLEAEVDYTSFKEKTGDKVKNVTSFYVK